MQTFIKRFLSKGGLFLRSAKFLFNFILPNLIPLINKKVQFSRFISNQKTLITGKGNIQIGEDCSFGYKIGGRFKKGNVELQARYNTSLIKIGNNVATNNNLFICAAQLIEIGDNCRIGESVTLMDFEAHGTPPDLRHQVGEIGTITIKNNVWIGNNVTILKNSEIGGNSIVAVGSVVAGKFPDNVIIGGIPAKIIKTIP